MAIQWMHKLSHAHESCGCLDNVHESRNNRIFFSKTEKKKNEQWYGKNKIK